MSENTEIQIFRLREVQARTGLPPSSLYQLIQHGAFPKPVRLSERRVGWLSTEVNQWIRNRVRERDELAARLLATKAKKVRQ